MHDNSPTYKSGHNGHCYPECVPLRAFAEFAEINPQTSFAGKVSKGELVSFIPMGDVTESGQWVGRQARLISSLSAGFTCFQDEDILIAKITPCLENGKGAHVNNLTNGFGFGSTEFHILRARPGNLPRFIFHITQSRRFRQAAEVQMVGSAGQKRVPSKFFKEFSIPVFSYEEQLSISAVLDTLDTVIHRTQSVIEKLKQIKQGLLHDLLTRGIDENGKLRPPVEEAPHLYKESELGWMPKEWACKSFGELCESSAFGPRFPSDAYDENGSLATLRTTDMDDEGNISLSTMPRAAIAPSVFADHLLRPGDIVISRSGTCGVTGVFVGHEIPVVPGAFLIRFRLRDVRLNRLYRRYFNSSRGRPYLERLSVGGVQKNIKGSDVLCLLVPAPSPAEAIAIAERVESVEHDIDINHQLLMKLTLQKSGLMDDLLTGRTRVTPLLTS